MYVPMRGYGVLVASSRPGNGELCLHLEQTPRATQLVYFEFGKKPRVVRCVANPARFIYLYLDENVR